MKLKCMMLVIAILLTSVLSAFPVLAADTITLLPPPDSQKYAPLTAKTTRVYVVETKNVYMACKIDISMDDVQHGYIFINQSLPYNSKFDVKSLSKGILVEKSNIVNGYIVFNMKDYKNVIENKAPNRVVVAIQKTDGTLVFSNIVLLTIATGEMSCESVISGEMVTYNIKQGFLPIDPGSISVTSNGNAIPFAYNNYKKSVTVFVAPSEDGNAVHNLKFNVKDLKGKSVTVEDTVTLDENMNSLRNKFTRQGLARYAFSLSGYKPAEKPFAFSDIDFIPYEYRLSFSALAANGLIVNGDKMSPNNSATQKDLSDLVLGLTKRQLYTPDDESADITVDQAIEQLLNITKL